MKKNNFKLNDEIIILPNADKKNGTKHGQKNRTDMT